MITVRDHQRSNFRIPVHGALRAAGYTRTLSRKFHVGCVQAVVAWLS